MGNKVGNFTVYLISLRTLLLVDYLLLVNGAESGFECVIGNNIKSSLCLTRCTESFVEGKRIIYFPQNIAVYGHALFILGKHLRGSDIVNKNGLGEVSDRIYKGNFDMKYLTVALAKGRLAELAMDMFEKIGMDCAEMKEKSRKLIFTDEKNKMKFILVKASDVPTYVEYGAADIGIAGKDIILEYSLYSTHPLTKRLWSVK